VFGQQPHREGGVPLGGNRRVVGHLKERAAAGQRPESRPRDERQEQVALALVEDADTPALGIVPEELRVRELDRAVDRERHPLVDALDLRAERPGRNRPADFPAGGMEGLAERADDDGAIGDRRMSRQAFVARPVEHDVLVRFVRDHDRVGMLQHARQLADIVGPENHPRRVMRRVQDDHPGSRRDDAAHLVPVDAVAGRPQRDERRRASAQLNRRNI